MTVLAVNLPLPIFFSLDLSLSFSLFSNLDASHSSICCNLPCPGAAPQAVRRFAESREVSPSHQGLGHCRLGEFYSPSIPRDPILFVLFPLLTESEFIAAIMDHNKKKRTAKKKKKPGHSNSTLPPAPSVSMLKKFSIISGTIIASVPTTL